MIVGKMVIQNNVLQPPEKSEISLPIEMESGNIQNLLPDEKSYC
jgi:hypothetical protein